ncbi:peptidoglycan bridge formation glycyltransferase FemA/FemB family protein [uncultured Enorma sp.]|uniref:lipid II:glycine glycyltransferase FemX n=1 Tax=uncultured Enorma sp. TaxID=1714346 RepID=UPI0026369C63|nr:peptidoglycan bridge formation glycyltransferase FemA/FemB family protein [uncultured Enorma sp.]
MAEYREVTDAQAWDEIVNAHAGHPMQAWGWGELKERTGSWTARRIVVERDGSFEGACQVLVRKLPWPFGHICYAPRGPVTDHAADVPQVADDVAAWCRANVSAVSLKIEPAVTAQEVTMPAPWEPAEKITLPNTAAIDLAPTEDEIMAGLHSKKARQYIRKAGRSGVEVRRATEADLDAIMDIYHHTAETDEFFLHSDEYYRTAFSACADVNQVFIAEIEGRPLAFLWNITTSGTAFELWGGVTDEGKRLRANYLLKWHAMCTAKESGAALYDMNGLLEGGVSTFKLLFAGEPTVWIGTFDRPLSPLYHVWDGALKLYRRLFK